MCLCKFIFYIHNPSIPFIGLTFCDEHPRCIWDIYFPTTMIFAFIYQYTRENERYQMLEGEEGGSPKKKKKMDHFHWLFVILHPFSFFFWPDGLRDWWCFDRLVYLFLLLCVCSWAGGLQRNGAYSWISVRILLHPQPPTGLPQRSLQTPPAAQVHGFTESLFSAIFLVQSLQDTLVTIFKRKYY